MFGPGMVPIVCALFLTKCFKKGGLTESQFLKGVFFFRGGVCSFYIKDKQKSEIFKEKKKKMLFSVITKNLN